MNPRRLHKLTIFSIRCGSGLINSPQYESGKQEKRNYSFLLSCFLDYFSTVTFVLTEFAIKHSVCAKWCISSSSCSVGCLSPENLIFGCNSTRVIAIFPFSFFSMWPTASSVYSSRTNFFLQATARNVSMWQLESDATNASSGSVFAGFPRYAGAADAVISWPPSNFQV